MLQNQVLDYQYNNLILFQNLEKKMRGENK